MLIEELFPPKLIVTNEQYQSAVVPGVHLFKLLMKSDYLRKEAELYIDRLM